jgi:hypothetical protein
MHRSHPSRIDLTPTGSRWEQIVEPPYAENRLLRGRFGGVPALPVIKSTQRVCARAHCFGT